MSDLVLATELIEEFDKIRSDSNKLNVQKGGFVFNLIPKIKDLFFAVIKVLGIILSPLKLPLFGFRTFKITNDPQTGMETIHYTLFIPPGQGYFYKFIWFCLKTSFYLVIFALGGFWVTLLAIGFVYLKLASKFKKMRYGDD